MTIYSTSYMERCHIRYTQRIERLRIEGGFCVLTARLCEARCVLRIAYCVLRMGCDARRPAVSMVAYCVLRIAYGVRRPKPAVSMVAYCVLRIAYCASAPFEAHCVLRIAYCVLRIWGATPEACCEHGCVLRIAYCVLCIGPFEAHCVLRIAYAYCVSGL